MALPRSYTKKRRAAQEEVTRQRIVEAAVELHQKEGGRATVSAIAERAGVGRVTLYRHFPDELALLTACTGHYLALHPPPDLDRWTAVEDPLERLQTGLTETYAYHRQTEGMMTVAEHEVAMNPVLATLLEPLGAYWAAARDVLAAGWDAGRCPSPLVKATIGLALALPTWRTLTRQQGLSDVDCVQMFAEMVGRLAGS